MATVDFNSPAGEQLLINLYAYSRGLFRQVHDAEVNSKGKSYDDYVDDAVENHLTGADKYDPSRGPVEYFLKFLVIKRNIINDLPFAVRAEYQKSKTLKDGEAEMQRKTPVPLETPELTEEFDFLEYDRELLYNEIEKEINGDDVVERIYLAVAHDKYHISDRQELCKDFDIASNDFDNGRRRFVTILKRVFKRIGLNLSKNGHK